MDNAQGFRDLAEWYRDFAGRTSNTAIWDSRMRTAEGLEAAADRIDGIPVEGKSGINGKDVRIHEAAAHVIWTISEGPANRGVPSEARSAYTSAEVVHMQIEAQRLGAEFRASRPPTPPVAVVRNRPSGV